jgi:FkbM family methyltransferase
MISLLKLVRFVTCHPVNRGHRLAAIQDLVKWQLGSRIVPGEVVVDWVEKTKLIVTNGEAGLTGNIYCGLHEFADMAFVLHFLRPSDQFFDIGANRGSYTVLASGVCGATTTAFEPIPETFSKLRANVRINDLDEKVRLQNVGLGADPAELFFSCSLDAANHIVDAQSDVPKIRVPVVRLDDVTQTSPHLIKIDVEGFELSVFAGAKRVLASSELKALIVEINDSGTRYGHSGKDLLECLTSYGFSPFFYDPMRRILEPTVSSVSSSGNTLFLRDLPFVEERIRGSRQYSVRRIKV